MNIRVTIFAAFAALTWPVFAWWEWEECQKIERQISMDQSLLAGYSAQDLIELANSKGEHSWYWMLDNLATATTLRLHIEPTEQHAHYIEYRPIRETNITNPKNVVRCQGNEIRLGVVVNMRTDDGILHGNYTTELYGTNKYYGSGYEEFHGASFQLENILDQAGGDLTSYLPASIDGARWSSGFRYHEPDSSSLIGYGRCAHMGCKEQIDIGWTIKDPYIEKPRRF